MSKLSDIDLYNQIINLKTLKPNSETNKAFSDLVAYTLDPKNIKSLNDQQISKLQEICSKSEYELEKYWALKILESKEPSKKIKEFPYYNNYLKLTQMEWYSLLSCTDHSKHNILFAGGGPLPLTAIILATTYVKKVTVLEVDNEAYIMSRELINKLGLKDKVKITKADASEYDNYAQYNTIVVAALAGIDKKVKKKILQKIRDNSPLDSHILARSSWGLREILYRPIDKDLYKMFDPVVEVHPQNDVVNSVVIFSNPAK